MAYNINNTYIKFTVLDYTNTSTISTYTLENTPLTFVPDFTSSPLLTSVNSISNKNARWDFGDGTYSVDLTATHRYKWPGSYDVTLTVYDKYGTAYDSGYSLTLHVHDYIASQASFSDYKSLIYDVPVGQFIGPLKLNVNNSWQNYNALSATGYTVNLYASGARGNYDYLKQGINDKWLHLRSLSRFYKADNTGGTLSYTQIDSMTATQAEVYVNIVNGKLKNCDKKAPGSVFAGTTGSCEFWYTDDLPSNLTTEDTPVIIFASLDTSKFNDPLTERINAYEYINYPPAGFQNYNPAVFPEIKTRFNPADHLSISTTGIDGEGDLTITSFNIPEISWQETEIPYIIKFKDAAGYTTKNYPPLSSSCVENNNISPQSTYDVQTSVLHINEDGSYTPLSDVKFYEDFTIGAPQSLGAFYKGYFVSRYSSQNCILTAGVSIKDPAFFAKDSLVGWVAIPQYNSLFRLLRQEFYNGIDNSRIVTFDNSNNTIFTTSDNNAYAITVASSGRGVNQDYQTWVCDAYNDRISKLDIDGNPLPVYYNGTTPVYYLSLSSAPTQVNNRVVYRDYRRLNATGTPLFASPGNITLDSDNNIWVSLVDSGTVIKFDTTNGYITNIAYPNNIPVNGYTTDLSQQPVINASSDYSNTNPTPGSPLNVTISKAPIAFYKLDSDASDSSGNGYNLDGTYTASSNGVDGQCFDGSGVGLCYLTDIWDIYANNQQQSYTVSFWYYSKSNSDQFITGSGFGAMGYAIKQQGGNIVGYIPAANYTTASSVQSKTKINTYQWYHIAVVYNAVNDTLQLFINGNLESQSNVTQLTLPVQYSSFTGFAINGSVNSGGIEYQGNAMFDIYALWDTALTPIDIQRLYDGGYLIQPTSVDTDSNDDIWVTYSHPQFNYLIKYKGKNNLDFKADVLTTNAFNTNITPDEVCVDRNQFAWVTAYNHNAARASFDTANDLLYKFDISNGLCDTVEGYPLSGFRMIGNLTVDGNQNAWVTHDRETLTKVNGQTQQRTNFFGGVGKNTTDYICSIGGMTCDTANNIWVINNFDKKMYIIDSTPDISPTYFTYRYSVNLSYPSTSTPPISVLTNAYSDGMQEFRAIGDWNGYHWINKYANRYSTVRTITGSSNIFNLYPYTGEYNISKTNEDWNAAGYYKNLRFQESLLDKQVFFDQFLGAIVGGLSSQPYELGKTVYEKISNFVENRSDVDKSNVDALIALCDELSVNYQDYNYQYPPQLRRLVDMLSIKQSLLWGTQNKYTENFDNRGTTFINNQFGSNLGPKIDIQTGLLEKGTPVVAFELFSSSYKLINTGQIPIDSQFIPLSSYNSSWGWNLTLPETISGIDIDVYYSFYEYIPTQNGTFYDNIIDWNNPMTTLTPQNSSYTLWSKDNGVVQNMLSYELSKGLRLFTSATNIVYNS
jgi:Concanavalin A-like lectin/glucanases superfamily/PKD domain